MTPYFTSNPRSPTTSFVISDVSVRVPAISEIAYGLMRLERDRRLQRPPAPETPGPDLPDRVPVAVPVALVGRLAVNPAADRVDGEDDRIATVVERVEGDVNAFVLEDVGTIAAHLVDDPLRCRRRVQTADTDVDVVVVEQHPGFGPLGGERALVRRLLDEVGQGWHVVVDALVEEAIEPEGRRQPHGANRCATRGISRDDGRRHRGWWAVDCHDWPDKPGGRGPHDGGRRRGERCHRGNRGRLGSRGETRG